MVRLSATLTSVAIHVVDINKNIANLRTASSSEEVREVGGMSRDQAGGQLTSELEDDVTVTDIDFEEISAIKYITCFIVNLLVRGKQCCVATMPYCLQSPFVAAFDAERQ